MDKILKCASILIETGCKIDYQDKSGRTPLSMLEGFRNLNQNNPIRGKIDQVISLCKKKIANRQVDFDCIIEKIKINDTDIIDKYNEFKQNLSSSGHSSQINDSELNRTQFNELEDYNATLLNFATSYNRIHIVRYLVDDEKIDINKTPEASERNQKKFPAAYIACSKGHYEILKIFIEHKIANGSFTMKKESYKHLLHELCSCFGSATDRTKAENYLKCFHLLVSCEQQFYYDVPDEYGCTPLYYASRFNIDEATKWLLKKTNLKLKTDSNETQFQHVKKEIFHEVLDECVELEMNEGEKNYVINFSLLIANNRHADLKQTSILKEIKSNNNLYDLLMHPVLRYFSHIGWVQLRHLFYIRLMLFLIFMTFFLPMLHFGIMIFSSGFHFLLL